MPVYAISHNLSFSFHDRVSGGLGFRSGVFVADLGMFYSSFCFGVTFFLQHRFQKFRYCGDFDLAIDAHLILLRKVSLSVSMAHGYRDTAAGLQVMLARGRVGFRHHCCDLLIILGRKINMETQLPGLCVYTSYFFF
jgi:hypothetical protein